MTFKRYFDHTDAARSPLSGIPSPEESMMIRELDAVWATAEVVYPSDFGTFPVELERLEDLPAPRCNATWQELLEKYGGPVRSRLDGPGQWLESNPHTRIGY